MQHARDDYAAIQDPTGRIPEDEPVFLIRGQDALAVRALKYYASIAEAAGVEPAMVAAVRRQAAAMIEWQRDNRPKVPDMPAPGTNEEHAAEGI